ncbi:hypothetical protein BO94DRAFT_143216 [Aspergillus sclerotioniger CBS 115572]|uniref:Uncharacterized protein n=1 Tax=Aspergillus sclerotioniger CBS 115572 TaxID=1450535 RepID=A0A317XBV0_9EURO|nr:hypothetical protein BO94DRAFT_143216 [Aspergillus sclerotioniger CBS 115572]PWY96023.1 hypothetical protein BO94DRAFT_143216 [Aspergillus sclerotioniger CBS 115572]
MPRFRPIPLAYGVKAKQAAEAIKQETQTSPGTPSDADSNANVIWCPFHQKVDSHFPSTCSLRNQDPKSARGSGNRGRGCGGSNRDRGGLSHANNTTVDESEADDSEALVPVPSGGSSNAAFICFDSLNAFAIDIFYDTVQFASGVVPPPHILPRLLRHLYNMQTACQIRYESSLFPYRLR